MMTIKMMIMADMRSCHDDDHDDDHEEDDDNGAQTGGAVMNMEMSALPSFGR